jgi:hypothetical protein
LFLTAAFLTVAAPAFADIYVGSWQVDQGPSWTIVPPAYTGQQAAALLFGGLPSSYIVTTVFGQPANADSWYSTFGGACGGDFPCGTVYADNVVVSTGGLYENEGDTSSYVSDWAIGSQYTNYAYLVSATPEPGFYGLLALGLSGLAVAARQRKRA